ANAVRGYMPGAYTRFGDVTPLLALRDDEFVVYGGGDEVDLRFTPPAPCAPGTERHWVLLTHGYYKDYKTDVTHTVEPLPFAAMSNFPYASGEHYPDDPEHLGYLAEWNTRVEPAGAGTMPAVAALAAKKAGSGRAAAPDPAPGGIWRTRHTSAETAASAWTAAVVNGAGLHYSLNTDLGRVSIEYANDSVVNVGADAGWYSLSTTVTAQPTPSAPGTPAASADVTRTSMQDAQYWVTNEATAEGSLNWQLMRFDLSSAPDRVGARNIRFAWVGHGEPTTIPSNHPTYVYLWNFATQRWDQVATGVFGGDVRVESYAELTLDGTAQCLECHGITRPAGVVMPSGVATIAPLWKNDANGDVHGPRPGPGGATALAVPYVYGAGSGVPCQVCHDPHGSPNVYHVPTTVNGATGISVTGIGQTMQSLCAACHTGSPEDWHWNCNSCHWGGHSGEPIFGGGNDCRGCHAHGSVFTHPPQQVGGCHGCAPVGSQWRTF
ncbi:MAG TPA: hypothetical protein VGK50_07090, partial [Coriobacteriia bacterium]